MLRLAARRAVQRSSWNTARPASSIADNVPPPTGDSNPNSDPSQPTPSSDPSPLSDLSPPVQISGVPATSSSPNSGRQHAPSEHLIPFDTHQFYKALEASFDPPVARTLMRATRGMFSNRIRQVTKETLHTKDFDNSAYLFKAALSELRTELTMRTRKETAALRTTLTALRKEVDVLDAKMKEEISNLKHEIQMDINNRKAESKADTKRADLAIEDFHHRVIVHIGDLRTEIEQAKWDNTRRGVFIIGGLVLLVIVGMELAPKRPPPPAPPTPAPPAPIIVERPLPSIRELEGDTTSPSTEPEKGSH